MQPQVFPSVPLRDYQLLDSGGGEKLERWGDVVLRRPDPQALWRKHLEDKDWDGADWSFVRESDRGGHWLNGRGKPLPENRRWLCQLLTGKFWIQPTAFKHVGAFPEQASNWHLLPNLFASLNLPKPRLLNLFGYTGLASCLARQAGFEVTHVDASKQSLNWAAENAQACGLGEKGVRWILEDALTFAQREVRRGSRYHVVLLDPPHYGRGPKGQKWQLESGLAALLEAARDLLEERALLILSTYAVGYSPLAFQNLLAEFGEGVIQAGELALPTEGSGRLLPAGFCARFWKGMQP